MCIPSRSERVAVSAWCSSPQLGFIHTQSGGTIPQHGLDRNDAPLEDMDAPHEEALVSIIYVAVPVGVAYHRLLATWLLCNLVFLAYDGHHDMVWPARRTRAKRDLGALATRDC